ncbi:MAG TPA: tetratricopeptide repeat protein [Holophagaceae bacterium]
MLTALAEDPRNAASLEPSARHWVEREPDSPEAWFALGLALDRRAEREQVPALTRKAAEAYERSLALRKAPRVWNNLGASLDAQNRFPEAEHAYQEALRLDPAYGLAWLNLGATRINAGNYQEAAVALRRGLALNPADAQGWVRLGDCLRYLRDWSGEAEALGVALRYRPLAWDLWLDRGVALARSGQREAAWTILQHLRDEGQTALAIRLQAALGTPHSRRR